MSEPPLATALMGTGLARPMTLQGSAGLLLASGETKIEQSIRLILATAPGERPMRPVFGCAIHDLVFSGMDAGSATAIGHSVRAALELWEPRITVLDVTADTGSGDPSELTITLTYRVNATNSVRNLIHPYYTIPPTPLPPA
ncbi:GPW/gp25 family protein [Streptomyces sp. NPDC051555]|uniref:GPW/gp25 family protein n=1 Tax=Streptomyces sp. NPDC051555 TaxID=3365657 RepID=UPI0037A2662B